MSSNNISKTKIRKVGRAIREELGDVSNKNLLTLQEYRKSFKDTLSEVFTDLTEESKKRVDNKHLAGDYNELKKGCYKKDKSV